MADVAATVRRDDAWLGSADRRSWIGAARAIQRLLGLLLVTAACVPIQSVLLLLPGNGKVRFARFYWNSIRRVLGMRVRVIGAVATGPRPVVFVANHSSWIDIPVLGSRLPACFVAKGEVGRWPLIGTVARLGRTVFVTRQRGDTVRERDAMRERLNSGDNLVLFPEGTTSDGSRVMAFRTSFFAVAEGASPPLIQPVSVAYDRLGGLPALRATRPIFAWYGDMDIASHYWRLAQQRGLRVSILLHEPIDPAQFANRKALSSAVWGVVAEGAAALRQNRPPRPLPRPAPRPAEVAAFA